MDTELPLQEKPPPWSHPAQPLLDLTTLGEVLAGSPLEIPYALSY